MFLRNSVIEKMFSKSLFRMKWSLAAAGIALTALCATATSAEAATYYVSKNGNNQDGKNWTSAWNELDQIKWTSIAPGDTIVLDGGNGNASMIYRTGLTIPVGAVLITRTSETGHNGFVVLDGGLSGRAPTGIAIQASSVRVEGLSWRGISIRGFGVGVGTTNYSLVRNVECRGNRTGAVLGGNDSCYDQLISHDNIGHNFVSGAAGNQKVSLINSWIYNTNPTLAGMSARGIETSNSSRFSTLTVNHCVVGPGLPIGIEVNDYVVVLNSLLLDAYDANLRIFGLFRISNAPLRLTAKNITSFMTSRISNGCCIAAEGGYGGPISIEKSIFYGGAVYLAPDRRYATETTQFRVTGNTTALSDTMVDPKFKSDVSNISVSASFDVLNQLDFSLQPNSPAQGRGSNLSSSKSLTGP